MTRNQCGLIRLTIWPAAMLMAVGAWAQQPAPPNPAQTKAAEAQDLAKLSPVANPVSGGEKNQLPRFQTNMVAAAEAMPAEKDHFKPTPDINLVANWVMLNRRSK